MRASPHSPGRRLTLVIAATAMLLGGTTLPVLSAEAASSCTKTAEEIYVHDLSDGHGKVKRGTKLEYVFVIQNNGSADCRETVAFHYSSRYLSIGSISGSGRVLKGKGQIAWRNQVIEPISTDIDYYYRVVATVRKTAPTSSYTTYATATTSETKIPAMTSPKKCVKLGDQCNADKSRVTR